MRAAIALLAIVVAGAFAAVAGAHSALLEARYCTNKDTVFVTASAWAGNGKLGYQWWKRSRTHDAVGTT